MERQSTDMVPLGRDGFFKDPFFSSSWEEFDQERNQRMASSKNSFWEKVESDMAEFEKSVAAMEADMNQRMAPYQGGVPSWALPENQHKNWSKILTDRPSTSNEMVPAEMTSSRSMAESSESSSPDKWTVSLDVQKFTPESLKVKVAGDLVTISGAMDSSNVGNSCESYTSQSFSRSFTLPNGCDPEYLSSTLSNSGQLVVTCPRPYYLHGPSPKALKI